MRVLITEHQLEHFADRYRQAVPGIELLVMAPDGSITLDGTPVDPSTADEEVAFGSTDLFDTAHDDRGQARDFFVHALKSTTLRWFHVAAAGVDDPVFGMLLDKDVRLTTSHHTAIPISEYVLAQVLRARLPLATLDAQRAERAWRGAEWDEIAASRWLVIGMGSIGAEVAHRARAFGARVTGVRRSPTGREPVDRLISPADVLTEVPDHDVIVLAVPATPATTGMVDADFLAAVTPGTILVNVGRGALIDEDALRSALDDGRPDTAVLDVTATEPLPPEHWLWDHPGVVLTPHTSAGGRQRRERAADVFADNLARYVTGQPLLDEVSAAPREAPPA